MKEGTKHAYNSATQSRFAR